MSVSSDTTTRSFLDNFNRSTPADDFLAAVQLRCLEQRLEAALTENRHSVVIDLQREIPLIEENRRLLEGKGFKCIYRQQSLSYFIFFPHIGNTTNLIGK